MDHGFEWCIFRTGRPGWGNGEIIPEEDDEGLNKNSGGTDVQDRIDFRNIQYIGTGCGVDSEKEKDFFFEES